MRKALNIVMVLSVATMGLAGIIAPAAQAVTAGALIKTSSNPAVYYYDGVNRFVFPNQKTYYTWYGNDFSDVQVISMTEMGDILLGGNTQGKVGD